MSAQDGKQTGERRGTPGRPLSLSKGKDAPQDGPGSSGRLSGQVAIVTGAGGMIGRAVALGLAREGADVVLHHGGGEHVAEVAATVHEVERFGRRAIAMQAELSAPDGAFNLVEATLAGFGRVDILINNAGLRPATPLESTSVEMFDTVMAANVRSVFLMVRLVLPIMFQRDYGRIVTTISDVAYTGAPGFSLCGAAAGAILGFTRSLAHDIGPRDITANCVAPGALNPKTTAGPLAAALEATRRRLPRQRLAEPADIAPAYLFLASPDARHIVGQCISPSGGAVML